MNCIYLDSFKFNDYSKWLLALRKNKNKLSHKTNNQVYLKFTYLPFLKKKKKKKEMAAIQLIGKLYFTL